jgi:predicted dehydrogenase
MSDKRVNVAMIGLGFGAEFIPIYQRHPLANVHAICRRNEAALNEVGDTFGIDQRYVKFEDVLADPQVDFVHINSPIPDHAWMSLEALKAGKHVMCTVPMATTVEDCEKICALVAETGLKYMMAETVVYSREFLFIKQMYDQGELGKIQYMQASHPQDMDGWPDYWERMIPMHYATHVVSPVLGLVDGRAEYVSCLGSGTVRPDIQEKSGTHTPSNPVISNSRTRTSRLTSGDFCMTRRGSTVSRSMFTGRRNRSSGHWSRARNTCCTRRRSLSPKFPNGCRSLISRICCPPKSSRSLSRSKTRTTCPSCREADMAARIHTW